MTSIVDSVGRLRTSLAIGRAAALFALGFAFATFAYGEDLNVLSTGAVKGPVNGLVADYQKKTGNTVKIEFGTAGQVEKKLAASAKPDLLITTATRLAALPGASKDRVRPLGTVRIGVAKASDAPKPDLESVEGFRASLLQARTVAYGNPSGGATTGVHFAHVVDSLGLAHDLADKRILADDGFDVVQRVVSGEAELGIAPVSEILLIAPQTYVGPLPEALQLATTYSVWLVDPKNTRAQGLVDALTSEEARAKFAAAGFE